MMDYTAPDTSKVSPPLINQGLSAAGKASLFAAALVELVGRILIERVFFQNLHFPPDLLLSLVNNFIQTLLPEKKQKISVYQEGVNLYKRLLRKPFTEEERAYEEADKELDVPGEILNGIKYSTYALMGKSIFTSINSAIEQGLWSQIPWILGYKGATIAIPLVIQRAVDKILIYYGFTQEQREIISPVLTTLGKLLLGFVPKVDANENGVHYHYPSTVGYNQTVTQQGSVTLIGENVTLEHKGSVQTPEGDFEADYEVQFKLQRIYEITQEKIRMQVINQQGKKIPVEFHIIQGLFGKEIAVKSTDKILEKYWQQYFQPKPTEASLSLSGTVAAGENTAQLTQIQITDPQSSVIPTNIVCQSALVLSALGSFVGQSALPAMIGVLTCLPKVTATPKRAIEQTSITPLTAVNLPLDFQLQAMVVVNGYAFTVNGAAGLKIFAVNDPNNVSLVAQYDTPGYAQNIVVVNGYAYIADLGGGLHIVNVKNITNPIFAGLWMTSYAVFDVAVMNNKAYIAGVTNTVTEIDVSIPENVYQAMVYNSDILSVAVAGSFAYIADSSHNFFIVDISNLANPRKVGNTATFSAYAITISGKYAFVAAGNSGVQIIDVNNTMRPTQVGSITTINAQAVDAVGNYAFVADFGSTSGLLILDVSNVTQPQLIGIFNMTQASGVVVLGSVAYVAGGYPGFYIIDVSNVTNPQLLGSLNTVPAKYIAVVGKFAYLIYGSTFNIVDISNITTPKLLGSISVFSGAMNIAISGNFAYVANSLLGLVTVDISNSTNPKLVEGISLNNNYDQDVAVVGNFVYVASSPGLRIIQVNPISTQTYFFHNAINQLVTSNNYLWVMQADGFQAFDPSVAMLSSKLIIPTAQDVCVSGNFAYVTQSYSSIGSILRVINVSNANNPMLLGAVSIANPQSVAVASNFVFIAALASGVQVSDVSDPTNPSLIGNVLTTDAFDIAAAGNFEYVADALNFLVINATNVTNPQRVGSLSINMTNTYQVAVAGNFAYLTVSSLDIASGLYIVDVSNATNPRFVGFMAIAYARDVAVSGSFAFIAADISGLLIIDVSNAANPKLVANVSTPQAWGVAVWGNFAFVLDLSSALLIIDLSNANNPYLRCGIGIDINGIFSRIVVSNKIVYIISSEGLDIFNTTQLPCSPYFAIATQPTQMAIAFPYAFIATPNAVEIWNITDAEQIQYVGSWNTSLYIYQIEVIGNRLVLGDNSGITELNITDPTNPQLLNNFNCTQPVPAFAVTNGMLYLNNYYQCQFQLMQSPTSAPQPSDNPPACPANQPLTLGNHAIQINQGQNLRLTPNDLSVNCGTTLNLGAVYTITSIDYAQIKVRDSYGNWNNATSFSGSDLSEGNVELIQDGSTNVPQVNFTATDGYTTLPETSITIQFSNTTSVLQIKGITISIQPNVPTLLTPQQFQITDVGTKLDNVVISVAAIQGGNFTLVNNTKALTDFTFYQVQNGQIQFVPNSSKFPNITFSVSDGSGASVLIDPLVTLYNEDNPNSGSTLLEDAAIGTTVGVLTLSALTAFSIFRYRQNQPRKQDNSYQPKELSAVANSLQLGSTH